MLREVGEYFLQCRKCLGRELRQRHGVFTRWQEGCRCGPCEKANIAAKAISNAKLRRKRKHANSLEDRWTQKLEERYKELG